MAQRVSFPICPVPVQLALFAIDRARRVATASVEDPARTSTAAGDLIANIRPDQWNAPKVQDVVNHLVAMGLVFAALIGDGPMPERGADHLGNDPVETYRASAALLHAAFARPGVLERSSYSGPTGNATGVERLQIRLYDLLPNGWDLLQATGIRAQIPEELAEQGPGV